MGLSTQLNSEEVIRAQRIVISVVELHEDWSRGAGGDPHIVASLARESQAQDDGNSGSGAG